MESFKTENLSRLSRDSEKVIPLLWWKIWICCLVLQQKCAQMAKHYIRDKIWEHQEAAPQPWVWEGWLGVWGCNSVCHPFYANLLLLGLPKIYFTGSIFFFFLRENNSWMESQYEFPGCLEFHRFSLTLILTPILLDGQESVCCLLTSEPLNCSYTGSQTHTLPPPCL